MDRREHWNAVYSTKRPDEVSWHQRRPDLSLEMIAASGVGKDAGIIDVGGGASALVDFLLDDSYSNLAVLDIASAALDHSRARLGPRAGSVEWIEGDVTSFMPPRRFGLWHDRALFHFLTAPEDRVAYVEALRRSVQPGGAVVLATFAADGPLRCSGLDVLRHEESSVLRELGSEFRLEESRRETHATPWRSEQRFAFFRLRRRPA